MNELVAEIGRVPEGGEYCGKNVLNIWIGLQSSVGQASNGVEFLQFRKKYVVV